MLSYQIQFIYYKNMRQAEGPARLDLNRLLSALNGHILNVHHLWDIENTTVVNSEWINL